MNETGYTVLKLTKSDGAYAYGKLAREFATGSTGAGGYLNARAVASGWYDVDFISTVGLGTTSLPVLLEPTYSADTFTGVTTVIGGSEPNGDLRAEATGYISVGGSTPMSFQKGAEYSGAFYAVYKGNAGLWETGKIGIGTTAGDISTSGYYEGNYTTRNIHEFTTQFDADSTDLTKTTTGSGVYLDSDFIDLQFNILNRQGELLSTAAEIAADPFVSGQRISILDVNGNVVASNYRTITDSIFTFSRSQNIDVFGTYTNNFGIKNEVVGQAGNIHTSEFYLYGNTASFDKVFVKSSGQTVLNESYVNHNLPNTGGITSASERANAVKYFNNQPINSTGVTGFIEIDLGFNENPNFTDLGNLVIYQGTSEDLATDRGSLVGNFPLNQIQAGQKFQLKANDGIKEGTPLFFKLAIDSEVGFSEELFNIGPFTLEPEQEGPDLNVYNQSIEQQIIVSDVSVQGGVGGVGTQGGHFAVGTSAVGSTTVVIQGPPAPVGTAIGSTTVVIQGNNSKLEIANDQGFALDTEQKTMVSSVGGSVFSTGSMIAGGSGHRISGDFDTIAGGALGNISGGDFNFIGGGSGIDIVGSKFASSLGGQNNDISGANHSVILGGDNNYIVTGQGHFLGGGSSNEISGTNLGADINNALVGGIDNRILNCQYGFIGAGGSNTIFKSNSVIGGGSSNIASGNSSVIFGGSNNQVLASYGTAAGRYSKVKAGHTGAVVFSDAHTDVAESINHNTFNLHFKDGIHVTGSSGIFINGNPVVTGATSIGSSQTLQQVTDAGSTTTNAITLENNLTLSYTYPRINLTDTNNNSDYSIINNDGSFGIYDATNTAFRLHISAAGNVGIGTINPLAEINTNAQYFNPITDGESTTLTIGNQTTGRGNILLQSNVSGDGEIMGGVYFIHSSGQADAHHTVAAIESRVAEHSNNILNGANLLFFTKPKGNGRGSGDPQLFIGDNEEVGIGTGDPACRFHVNAEANEEVARFESQDNDAFIRIKDNTDSVFISHDASDDIMGLGFNQSASSSNLNITSAGDVGIGTTDPDEKLEVLGNILVTGAGSAGPHLKLAGTYTTWEIENQYAGGATNDMFRIRNAALGSDALVINRGNNNVGIGITEPDQTLHVKGIGMIEDASSNSYGTLQFGTDTLRYIRGNSAELQVGSTIQQLHFQKTNAAAQIGAGAADGVDAIQLLARTVHTSANIVEVINGQGQAPIFSIDYTGNVDISGHVGIGTTSPAVELDVVGTGDFDSVRILNSTSTLNPRLILGRDTNQNIQFHVVDNDCTITADQDSDSDGNHKFILNRTFAGAGENVFQIAKDGTTQVTVDTNGNVGIGSDNPDYTLDVAGTIGIGDYAVIDSNSTYMGRIGFNRNVADGTIFNNTKGAFQLQNYLGALQIQCYNSGGVIQKIHSFTSDGNVGIGTDTPDYRLDLGGNTSNTSNTIRMVQGNDGTAIRVGAGAADNDVTLLRVDGGSNGTSGASDSGAFGFSLKYMGSRDGNSNSLSIFSDDQASSQVEAVTILQDGKVGIGTTSPDFKLEVVADDSAGVMAVRNAANARDTFRSENAAGTRTVNIGNDANAHGLVLVRGAGGTITSQIAGNGDTYFDTDTLYIDHSTDRVGIGTTNPATELTVIGNISGSGNFLGTGDGGRITKNHIPYLLSGDAGTESDTLQTVTTRGNTTSTSILSTGPHISGVTGLFADRIGIGVTDPDTKLEVDGNIKISAGKFYRIAGSDYQVGTDGVPSRLQLHAGGSERISISGDGKVGIGITDPESLVHIYGGNSTQAFSNINAGLAIENDGSSASHYVFQTATAGGGKSFSITNAGNVGIGTDTAPQKLTVKGTIVATNSSNTQIAGITNSSNHGRLYANNSAGLTNVLLDTDGVSYLKGGNVGIGTTSPSNALDVVGHFSATSKSFLIDHPTKKNKKLQYASLEGPENGVYVRGINNNSLIELPEYWSELVHEDSITVILTAIGKKQDLYVKSQTCKNILIGGVKGSYNYIVYGERKDIDKLEIEPLKV